MKEKSIKVGLAVFIVIGIVWLFIRVLELQPVGYECTDVFGNTIYCKTIRGNHGNIWGIMQDGTMVKILRYKEILKEE